jgi:transcription termination factor Rho
MQLPRAATNDYADPSIRVIGVGGAITGAHPNVLIKDDLVSIEAANSPVVMQTAIDYHISSRALLAPNEDRGLEFIIGTRWAVRDLYEHIQSTDPTVAVKIRSIIENNEPIWKGKVTREYVDALRKEYGAMFYLLYMNSAADPELKVYCLLVDERPEEVTDFRRSVTADVRFSSSDQSYDNHINVAKTLMTEAVERANKGEHVMILIDSLTRLARVHNSATRGVGRTLSGGMDAGGMLIPRKIFGSARNIEHGGSLGILATILVDTGSRMDELIFQEFKGTGNMELVLSREVSDRRIFPAINIRETGTRKEELLFTPEELKATRTMRGALASMKDIDAAQALNDLLLKYPTNKALLASLA